MDQSAEKVFIEGFKALSTKLQEKSARLGIWWRDDDLSFWNARVGTFVERTAALDASVLVSAIPEKLDYLSWRSAKIPRGWRIGQHGYSHENFAAPGAANSEYPTDRVGDVVSYELEFGQWAIKRTGQPEPLVREVLGCASRWLDEVYEEVVKRQPEALGISSDDGDEGAEPV